MRKLAALSFAVTLATTGFAQVKLLNLLTENKPNPISVDALNPRFSWQLDAGSKRGVMQSAYEIKVSSTGKGKHEVWKTGKVASDQSMYVTYKGEPLHSGEKYTWQVRVWDNGGKASAWSAPATWQMGLLSSTDWKAKWIIPGFKEDSVNRPSPLFRKVFALDKKVSSAMLYITSHGLYEAQINGHRVGDAYLTPGWTSFNKRLQYQAYDVTNLLQPGANAIGAELGSGWYRGHIGFENRLNYYGKDIALLAQLEVTYTDGTTATIISDDSWKSSTGPVRFAEIYNGATIDDRRQQMNWSTTNFNDQDWSSVAVKDFSKDILVATYSEPNTAHNPNIMVLPSDTPR